MILQFHDEYRWLSNFWPAKIMLDGIEYETVEHAYQAAKFPVKSGERWLIQVALRPGQAKRIGTGVEPRPDKVEVMEDLLRQKFAAEPLRTQLINTGDLEIVDGNNWNDTFWGVCNGIGENQLGRLIMKIRSELQGRLI